MSTFNFHELDYVHYHHPSGPVARPIPVAVGAKVLSGRTDKHGDYSYMN